MKYFAGIDIGSLTCDAVIVNEDTEIVSSAIVLTGAKVFCIDAMSSGKLGLLKRRGLTLKQTANRTGLSVSLISQIELGKSAASMSTLHKLATALQVKMTYFFETL